MISMIHVLSDYGEGRNDFTRHLDISQEVYLRSLQDVLLETGIENIYNDSLERYVFETNKFFSYGDKSCSDVVSGVKFMRKEHYDRCKKIFTAKFCTAEPFVVDDHPEDTIRCHLDYLTCAAATRNLPCGDRALSVLVGEQQHIFSSDRSNLDNVAQRENAYQEIERRLLELLAIRRRYAKPAPIKPKLSSVLEMTQTEGGLAGFQEELITEFISMRVNSVVEKVLSFGNDFGIFVRGSTDERNGNELKDFVYSDGSFIPGLNYPQMAFLAAIHKCIAMGMGDILEGDLRLDPDTKPSFRGAIIVELANKFRTVSVFTGVMITIGRYLASCMRSILLSDEVYYEGYFVSEDVNDLLSRIAENQYSRLNAAIKDLKSEGKSPKLRVPDFSSATEYMSWEAVKLVARALDNISIEYYADSKWLRAIAEYLQYSASPFNVEYTSADGRFGYNVRSPHLNSRILLQKPHPHMALHI